MFTEVKRHDTYRDSGVVWLPQIPAHWESRRLKTVVAEKNTKGYPDEPLLAATQSRGVIRKSDYGIRTVEAQKSLETLKLVEIDDFVISLRSFQGGIERAYARGIISPAYTVLEARREGDRDYLTLLFKSREFIDALKLTVTGIREGQNIEYPRLARDLVPVPPADEQAAIVKYLGHAHARIDRAIAAKRKLIALIEEQIQAIIHQAVTRGLNAAVPLKDSGIPWLGEIPAHWEAAALRYRYTQTLGKMLDGKRNVGANPIPYLRNTDVQWGQVRTVDLPLMDITPEEYPGYTVSKGDVLVCEGGEVGRAAIWNGEGIVGFQKALHRLRPLGNEVPEFLLLVLRTAKDLGAFDNGRVSTIAHLTGEQLRSARFAWPAPDEQRAIVARVGKENGYIDALRTRVDREIELLREFRTRLTSDVVTGQVDVREISATLPELTDDMLANTSDDAVDTELEDAEDFTEGEDD